MQVFCTIQASQLADSSMRETRLALASKLAGAGRVRG